MTHAKNKKVKTLCYTGEILIAGCIFAALSYQSIPVEIRFGSVWDFCWLWGVCLAVGIITTPSSKYSTLSSFGILAVPFSLDCLTAYYEEYCFLVISVCVLAGLGYILLACCICYPDIRKGFFKRKWRQFLQYCLFRIRIIVSFLLVFSCIGFGLWKINDTAEEQQTYMESAEQVKSVLESMDNNMELMRQLKQNNWITMCDNERIEVLQQVVDAEVHHLGIPYCLELSVSEMEINAVRGSYSNRKHTVYINKNLFDTEPIDHILPTVFHEVYHAYQHSCVDALEKLEVSFQNLELFEDVWVYSEEFDHYISGSENFEGYQNQLVERSSREYASRRLQDYRIVISTLK